MGCAWIIWLAQRDGKCFKLGFGSDFKPLFDSLLFHSWVALQYFDHLLCHILSFFMHVSMFVGRGSRSMWALLYFWRFLSAPYWTSFMCYGCSQPVEVLFCPSFVATLSLAWQMNIVLCMVTLKIFYWHSMWLYPW